MTDVLLSSAELKEEKPPGIHSRRSPGERNGYPLQYSCLGNSMDRGAWQATVHGGPKIFTLVISLSKKDPKALLTKKLSEAHLLSPNPVVCRIPNKMLVPSTQASSLSQKALFSFWGTSILFSIVTIAIYISTNSVGGFPFLHTLSSIYYLWTFW